MWRTLSFMKPEPASERARRRANEQYKHEAATQKQWSRDMAAMCSKNQRTFREGASLDKVAAAARCLYLHQLLRSSSSDAPPCLSDPADHGANGLGNQLYAIMANFLLALLSRRRLAVGSPLVHRGWQLPRGIVRSDECAPAHAASRVLQGSEEPFVLRQALFSDAHVQSKWWQGPQRLRPEISEMLLALGATHAQLVSPSFAMEVAARALLSSPTHELADAKRSALQRIGKACGRPRSRELDPVPTMHLRTWAESDCGNGDLGDCGQCLSRDAVRCAISRMVQSLSPSRRLNRTECVLVLSDSPELARRVVARLRSHGHAGDSPHPWLRGVAEHDLPRLTWGGRRNATARTPSKKEPSIVLSTCVDLDTIVASKREPQSRRHAVIGAAKVKARTVGCGQAPLPVPLVLFELIKSAPARILTASTLSHSAALAGGVSARDTVVDLRCDAAERAAHGAARPGSNQTAGRCQTATRMKGFYYLS
jgi:hypothetical protein